ncbi:MAG TPA: VTT domain-containing protein [Candidatus Paceibacterota bacterium]|nr:VTT domain-containing protein [Candidatus Paceibacterota bacterium]
MLSIHFIKHFTSDNAIIVYLLIAFGMVIEGEVVVVLAGIFAHLGSLHLFWIGVFIAIGGFVKSVLGYSLGYYLQKHHSERKLVRKAENRINYFLPNFIKKPFLSLFLARFLIMGMHSFALVYAGYKKVKLSTFIKAESISLVIWSFIMVSIGYFFSLTALSISRDVRKFIGIILIFFILFFIVEKIVAFLIELFEIEESGIKKE